MGCHFLLQKRIFPTQGSNPGLLHCRWILYCWATWTFKSIFALKYKMMILIEHLLVSLLQEPLVDQERWNFTSQILLAQKSLQKKSVFDYHTLPEVYSSKTTSAEGLKRALLNRSPVLDSQPSVGPRHWAATGSTAASANSARLLYSCFLSFQIIVLNFGTQTSNGFPCWRVAAGWT